MQTLFTWKFYATQYSILFDPDVNWTKSNKCLQEFCPKGNQAYNVNKKCSAYREIALS